MACGKLEAGSQLAVGLDPRLSPPGGGGLKEGPGTSAERDWWAQAGRNVGGTLGSGLMLSLG